MLLERTPGTGCGCSWGPRSRGGGNADLVLMARALIPTVSGDGSTALVYQLGGAAGSGVSLTILSDGTVSVARYDSSGFTSSGCSAGGLLAPAGNRPVDFYITAPKSMLTGTNATVYHNANADGSWDSLAMVGASGIGGTANDLNGEVRGDLYGVDPGGGGRWGLSRLLAFQGGFIPTRDQAFAIAAGQTDPASFLGLCFNARLETNFYDSVGLVNGTPVDAASMGSRRRRFI